MAILISPSNNTGWGLGCKTMYGGARSLSADHPVLVRRHYRASWGSRRGRVPAPTVDITADPVADVVEAVAASTARRRRTRRRRRASAAVRVARALVRGARRRLARRGRVRRTKDPVADVVRAVEETARANPPRRSSRIRARAVTTVNSLAPRNIYWVRDQNGQRIPVTSRPQRSVGYLV